MTILTIKPDHLVLAALCCLGAVAPASGQTVYKCGSAAAPTYSDQPCSGRIVNTDEAPVPPKSDLYRLEQSRLIAQTMRRLPGESTDHFQTRRRRARLIAEDQDECARLDTRMPVEAAGMSNPDKEEAAKFEAALERSRKRFATLGC
jgi:hypothetical protein